MFNFFKTKKIAISAVTSQLIGEASKIVKVGKSFFWDVECLNAACAEIRSGDIDTRTIKFSNPEIINKFEYQKDSLTSEKDYTKGSKENSYLEKNFFHTEFFQDEKSLKFLKILEPFIVNMLRAVARRDGWILKADDFIVKTNVCESGYFLVIYAEGEEPFKIVSMKKEPLRNIRDIFFNNNIDRYVDLYEFVKYYKDPDNFSYLAASCGIYDLIDCLSGPHVEGAYELAAIEIFSAIEFYNSALTKSLY